MNPKEKRMLSWVRNKLAGSVYLDCYTANAAAFEFARITRATKFIPDWWKSLAATTPTKYSFGNTSATLDRSTMKSCLGFIDLYKKSLCLPLWSELLLSVGPEGSEDYFWKYADGYSNIEIHPAEQRGGFLGPQNYQHFKLLSPWFLKCSEDIDFLMFDPSWGRDKQTSELIIPPGVLGFKNQFHTNINLFVRRLDGIPKTLHVPFNTPLVFIAPLTERKIVLRYHLINPEEEFNLARPTLTFNNQYKTIVKERRKNKKCLMKSK